MSWKLDTAVASVNSKWIVKLAELVPTSTVDVDIDTELATGPESSQFPLVLVTVKVINAYITVWLLRVSRAISVHSLVPGAVPAGTK